MPRRLIAFALIATIGGAAALLAFVLLSVMGMAASMALSGESHRVLGPLRSYLTRNAWGNAVHVLAVALPLASLLGAAVVAAATQAPRLRPTLIALLLLPLALPVTLATPAWRQLLAAAVGSHDVGLALTAMGLIQAWRVLPAAALCIGLAYNASQRDRARAMGLMLALSAYVILSDVAVVLFLTGGAPFNATHLPASWSYQTAFAAAMPVDAAVQALPLMAALAGCAWAVIHLVRLLLRPPIATTSSETLPRRRETPAWWPARVAIALISLVLFLLLSAPLLVILDQVRDLRGWPAALELLWGRTDYGFWLANTMLLAACTALAALTALPLGQRLANWASPWSRRLSMALAVLGMTALPLAYLPLAGLLQARPVDDGRWLLAALCMATTLSLGVALTAEARQSAWPVADRTLLHWLTLLGLLIAAHETTASLALSAGASRAQTLAGGLATRLLFDVTQPETVLGFAVLLPTLLLAPIVVSLCPR